MTTPARIGLTAAFMLWAATGCKGGGAGDPDANREIPPETKAAELRDSTRLDPAEENFAPVDSVWAEPGSNAGH